MANKSTGGRDDADHIGGGRGTGRSEELDRDLGMDRDLDEDIESGVVPRDSERGQGSQGGRNQGGGSR